MLDTKQWKIENELFWFIFVISSDLDFLSKFF